MHEGIKKSRTHAQKGENTQPARRSARRVDKYRANICKRYDYERVGALCGERPDDRMGERSSGGWIQTSKGTTSTEKSLALTVEYRQQKREEKQIKESLEKDATYIHTHTAGPKKDAFVLPRLRGGGGRACARIQGT